MVFWWFSSVFLVVFWWFSGGFLVVFWWFSGGFLVVFWWFSGGFLVVFWWFSVDAVEVDPKNNLQKAMVFVEACKRHDQPQGVSSRKNEKLSHRVEH